MISAQDLEKFQEDLRVTLRLYKRNSPLKLEATAFLDFAEVLDTKREGFEDALSAAAEGEQAVGQRQSVADMTAKMEDLANMLKDLAELKENYLEAPGKRPLAAVASDLAALREKDGEMKDEIQLLIDCIPDIVRGLNRSARGALNSEQNAEEKRSYRREPPIPDEEYRRGLRHCG